MFEFFRSHQRLMQVLLLLLIAPAFVLVGLEGYSRMGAGQVKLATVGGDAITQEQFEASKKQRIEEARVQSGSAFDPKIFEKPEVNRQLLDAMVLDLLLGKSIEKQHLTVSDQALQEEIKATPLFQKDGLFDMETFQNQLQARGYTPVQYDSSLRFGLARAQVLDPLARAQFFGGRWQAQLEESQLAGRWVQLKTFALSGYAPLVKVADADVERYYQEHSTEWMQTQSATVAYVVLSPDEIKQSISVSEDDLKTYYEQNKARLITPEERRARHILMPAEKAGLSPDVLEKEAKAVLAQVRDNPSRFAELAKQHSIDTGSAVAGGDLGFFGKGMMVPEFEKAVYALQPDAIADLVKTQFGYHIVQLTEVRGGKPQEFLDVKAQLAGEIKTQKSLARLTEAQAKFSDLAYEGGQSFAPLVKALELREQQFENLSREPNPQAPAVLQDPALLAEVFSEASLQNRNNTKALQVGSALVSVRVLKHSPAKPKLLAEVRAQIVSKIQAVETQKLANRDAQALADKLNQANASPELKGFTERQLVSLLGAEGLDPTVAKAVLNTPASALPTAQVVAVPGKGLVVAWVQEQALLEQMKAKTDAQMLGYFSSVLGQAYQDALLLAAKDSLKNRISVKINKTF